MNKKEEIADVVILGFGTAGSNAASAACKTLNDCGKVVVIHDETHWNTCVQRGCMPTKSLLGVAKSVLHARHTKRLQGMHGGEQVAMNLEETIKRMQTHRKRFEDALFPRLHEQTYQEIHGYAKFVKGGDGVIVKTAAGDEQIVKGKRYVIAVGSSIFVPPIDGIDTIQYWTSDTIMDEDLKKVPETLLVVGAGPIGLEMATFFTALGTKVTLVNNRELIGSRDTEVAAEVRRGLEEIGITVITGANVKKFEQLGFHVVAQIEQEGHVDRATVDRVLIATGRRPNLSALDIEHAGVEMDERGRVISNEGMQTSNPNIYIAGDVAGKNLILHVAAAEGRVAGHNAAVGKIERTVDYEKLKMGIIFSVPQVAFYGLTEPEAHEKGIEHVSAAIHTTEFGRGITDGDMAGIWKLIADPNGRILGAEIVGEGADDLIHLVKLAVEGDKTIQDIVGDPMWYHPTRSELFKTVARKVAAQLHKKLDGTICAN